MRLLSAFRMLIISAVFAPLAAGAAEFTPSVSASGQDISDALNKMACYVQALNDYNSSKFRKTVEDRYTAWDKRRENVDDPYRKPVFREAVNGFSSRYERAVSDNAGYALRLEPADSALAQFDEAYKRLFKTLKDIDRYYARDDWKEDGQAKPEEWMKDLRVGLLPLAEAHEQLLASYDSLYGPLVDLSVSRLEKAGSRNYYWHAASLLRQAEKLLPQAPLDPAKFDAVAFRAELDKFVVLADAHEDYLDAAGDSFRSEANSKLRTSLADNFVSTARTMLGASEQGVVNRYLNHIPVLHSAYNNMASDVYQIRFNASEYPRIPARAKEAPKSLEYESK